MSEIDTLIAEYNRAEADQLSRLRQIYDLVKASGPGLKEVSFTNGKGESCVNKWSNCFALHPSQVDTLLNDEVRPIVSYVVGSGG